MAKRIPDLHYKVMRFRPAFSPVGHLLMFYRHDAQGKAYLYHAESFYGENGHKTRKEALRRARAVVTRQEHFSTYGRSIWVAADRRHLVGQAGLYIPDDRTPGLVRGFP